MSNTKHGMLATTEQRVLNIEQWIGTKIEVVTTTYNQGQWGISGITWEDSNKADVFQRVFGEGGRQLIVAYEMGGLEGHNEGDYSKAASGAYDDYHRQLAEELIDLGMEDTILRPNHEFNLSWASKFPNDPANYASAFARVVREMQSVSGANFTFCYSPARNRIGVADECWPVDAPEWPSGETPPVIAPTFYDTDGSIYPTSTSDVTQSQREQNWQEEKEKLDMWQAFGDERGSPGMASPEWGVANDGYPNDSGGDNPYFIQKVAEYAEANEWVYLAYWNAASGSGGSHELFPRDAAGLPLASDMFRETVGPLLSSSSGSSDDGTDSTSSYGDYKKPAQGELNWHVPLNENFTSIEEDIKDLDRRVRNLEG